LVIDEAGILLQQYFYKQHAIPDFESMYILINLTKLYNNANHFAHDNKIKLTTDVYYQRLKVQQKLTRTQSQTKV